jgi:hypothetical protein
VKVSQVPHPPSRDVDASNDPAKAPVKTQIFVSNIRTLQPPPKMGPSIEAKKVLEIDGADAESVPPPPVLDIDGDEALSIPPSSPPSSDPFATLPRISPAAPLGVKPPVSEHPVVIEPKVVIAARRSADVLDIPISDSVPPSSAVAPTPRLPGAASAIFGSGAEPARHHFDTPAAAPVMAPAPLGDQLVRVEPAEAPFLSDPAPTRNARRGRVIVAVVSAACLVIGALAGFQFWQKKEQGAASTAETGTSTATAHAPAPARTTPAEATNSRPPEPPPVAMPPAAEVPSTRPSSGLVLPSAPPENGGDTEPMPATEDTRTSPSPGGSPMRAPKPWGEPSPTTAPPSPRPKFDPKRI